eukprot:6236446-Amphidinium_carterae.1
MSCGVVLSTSTSTSCSPRRLQHRQLLLPLPTPSTFSCCSWTECVQFLLSLAALGDHSGLARRPSVWSEPLLPLSPSCGFARGDSSPLSPTLSFHMAITYDRRVQIDQPLIIILHDVSIDEFRNIATEHI